MYTATTIALLATLSGPAQPVSARMQLAQATTPTDPAHTLVQPNAPNPGRAGQIEQLPQGGIGVTTGGTSQYQTYSTPGGGGIAVPNGNNTSSVIGSGGRSGTATTPR